MNTDTDFEAPEIVGIGANVCDTLIRLPHMPPEDTKLRAESVLRCGGGPCATGLTAASKLGAACAFIGNLADDADGRFLRQELLRYGISDRWVESFPDCASFSSWVLLSRTQGTRTCVFDRGSVPPLILDGKRRAAVTQASLLMVDGNELDAAVEAAKLAKKVLYDAGGLYEGVERLLPFADILIPSEEFALGYTGAAAAEEAAARLYQRYHPEILVITQGKAGGILYLDGKAERYPAFPVETADSNGAGDVFHGAFAYAVVRGLDARSCCIFASAVSALKCTRVGARAGAPNLGETLTFLKERGCNESECNEFEKKLGR